MSIDTPQAEESLLDSGEHITVKIADLHSETIRVALLRLNYLHRAMQTIDFQFFLDPRGKNTAQEEYNAIKERVEKRMPGFNAWYCNECHSHMLVPQQLQRDAHVAENR